VPVTTIQDARREDAGGLITITLTRDQTLLLTGPEHRQKLDAFLSEKA
jgi:hypothetical protein